MEKNNKISFFNPTNPLPETERFPIEIKYIIFQHYLNLLNLEALIELAQEPMSKQFNKLVSEEIARRREEIARRLKDIPQIINEIIRSQIQVGECPDENGSLVPVYEENPDKDRDLKELAKEHPQFFKLILDTPAAVSLLLGEDTMTPVLFELGRVSREHAKVLLENGILNQWAHLDHEGSEFQGIKKAIEKLRKFAENNNNNDGDDDEYSSDYDSSHSNSM